MYFYIIRILTQFLLIYRYFTYLSVHGDKTRYNIGLASIEANQCQDLLSQAQYHVSRARRIDEEEKSLRQKQEDELAAFKMRQLEDRKRVEEERNKTKEELLLKRQEFKEKTKNALLFSDSFFEKKKGMHSFIAFLSKIIIIITVSFSSLLFI